MPGRALEIMEGGRIPVCIGAVGEVELQEFLDTGAFGSLWRAVDTETGRPYALKIIQGIVPGSVLAERVRLEASVSIPSAHIVPALGLCEWDPSTFLILFEYFQSTALDKRIEAGSLTSSDKKEILIQMLLAVSHAHRHNVIHRDLKPANVLVNDSMHVKLIDFGISKFKHKEVTRGEIIGTFEYMAPELVIHGARVADARADIFSAGQIFYELAMGQNFWVRRGWSHFNDFLPFLNQVPPPTEAIDLSDFTCDFFPRARSVVARMVKMKPEERYASVDDVLADLSYVPESLGPAIDMDLRCPLLIVESGDNRGARNVLGIEDGAARVLGRGDIAGNDESISRQHLEISRCGSRYMVRDLRSKNGTMLRGLVLAPENPPTELRPGDPIKVGDVFLRFAFLPENSAVGKMP